MSPIGVNDVVPRWDVSDLWPSPASREFAVAHEEASADVTRLSALYDEAGVGSVEPHAPSAAEVADFERVLAATNATMRELARVSTYLLAHVATDSRDDVAQAMASRLDHDTARLSSLRARLTAWIASLGAASLIDASVAAADHAWPLRNAETRANHQMTDAEEDLASALTVTGAGAWARLHSDLTSQIEATLHRPDGHTEVVPVTVARALGNDPDPALRRAAYAAEVAAYAAHAVPIAAALNAIKGEAVTLNDRRGWADPLDWSLHSNAVDRATLDAMTTAVVDALPDFRRWMRAKARLH